MLADPELYLSDYEDRLVILDEINRLPGIFQTLRRLIDRRKRTGNRTGQFLFLGSASIDLLQQTRRMLPFLIVIDAVGKPPSPTIRVCRSLWRELPGYKQHLRLVRAVHVNPCRGPFLRFETVGVESERNCLREANGSSGKYDKWYTPNIYITSTPGYALSARENG
jgi:hypothetical protein